IPQSIVPNSQASTVVTDPTEGASIVGTISYMSPEQVLGETLDARSDLFSFGIVLYEMATGTLPFRENTWTAIANAIVNKTPQSIFDLNPAVTRQLPSIIGRAME